MKSFKQYLEEKYDEWNYDIPKHGRFESDKNNIYHAQDILRDAPKELIDDVKQSLEKDGKLPKGKEYEDVYKALFVMNHASNVKNLSALRDKDLASKQDDFKELIDKTGIDSEQVFKTGDELATKEVKEKKSSKEDDNEKESDTEESGNKEADSTPKDDTTEDDEQPSDDNESDKDEEDGSSGDESESDSEKEETPKSKKKEREIDSGKSEEAEDMVQSTIQKFQDQIDSFEEKDDRRRLGKVSKIQKSYQNKTKRLLDNIKKQEQKLSDPDLPFDWKTNAKRDIAKAINTIKAETRNANADLSKNRTRTTGEKVVKGAKDAAKAVRDTGEKIAKSKAGYVTKKAAQGAAVGMKKALDKAAETGDTIKRSKTGQAVGEKIKQAQEKVKAGIKQADTAVSQVVKDGARSEPVKKAREALSGVKKAASSKLDTVKKRIEQAKQNRADNAGNKKKVKETKEQLQKRFIKKKKKKDDEEGGVKQAAQ